MSDIEHMQGWHPYKPSCYSCTYYDEGTEYGDYGVLLSCNPNCFNEGLMLDQEDAPEFPYDDAPLDCVVSGRYTLDLYHAFWTSPFCTEMDGSEEVMGKAFNGLVWWLENIKAVGI